MVYIHTKEYYSVIKRNEVMIHATTWMKLENMMLCERSQTQQATYCMSSFLWNVQNKLIYRDRRYIKSFQEAGGKGELGVTANGHWVSLGWQHSEYTKNHFKMASFMLYAFHLNFLNGKKSQCSNKEYHGISMAIIRVRNGFSIMMSQ